MKNNKYFLAALKEILDILEQQKVSRGNLRLIDGPEFDLFFLIDRHPNPKYSVSVADRINKIHPELSPRQSSIWLFETFCGTYNFFPKEAPEELSIHEIYIRKEIHGKYWEDCHLKNEGKKNKKKFNFTKMKL